MKANPQVDSPVLRHFGLWLALAALPLLTSCAGTTMRAHFADYNAAYADALNQQMLLNLARLENGHPAYYLAIGAINDRLTVSESGTVGNTGSFTESRTKTSAGLITRVYQTVFGYNAGGTATRSSNPEFQFIPLNNDAVSKQVLQPVLPEVFYTLYQQGYPIDQLMRVMIERIETTLPDGRRLVLVNSPTGGTPESYGKFLRSCAILRELQLRGCLSLQATNQAPEPLGPVSFGGSTGAKGGAGGRGASADNAGDAAADKGSASNPTIKDYVDVQDKGWTLVPSGNGWQLARLRQTPIFMLNTDVIAAAQAPVKKNAAVEKVTATALGQYNLSSSQLSLVQSIVQSLTNSDFGAAESEVVIADEVAAVFTVMSLLNEGISVQTKVTGEAQARTRLVLRSFGRTMEAVAGEQPAFDKLVKTDPHFRAMVPDLENHPVLRIDWSGARQHLAPPLQTTRYQGRTYQITDPVADPLDPHATWNRDIFRLLVALNSQVTVDISKFQQRVFELRTD